MEIVIHGTKGGYKVLYQTPNVPFSIARDVRRIDRNDGNTVGQTAYAIAWVNGGCAFTKYVVVRDIERAAIGNIAFSVYIPGHRKIAGRDVKMLLDKLAEEYCRNYVIEGNLGNKQEDWAFVSKLLGQYEKYCYPEKEVMENYRQGIGEAAYIYYSAIELQKYFDYPCQEAYKPYMQIFFVERQYEHKPQDPLNSLRHDSDANLTGKVIPENRRKVLEPPRYEKGDNGNVGETNKGNEIEVNKGGNPKFMWGDKRRRRLLKKLGIWGGGIVLVVLGIIGVVAGVLNEKETDVLVQDEVDLKAVLDSASFSTLCNYRKHLETQRPEIREKEKHFWEWWKEPQKDSVEYKKWEKWCQLFLNRECELYLSGTELFFERLKDYEGLISDEKLLENVRSYKNFRMHLDRFEFTTLIDDVKWRPFYPSQTRFINAFYVLEKIRGFDGKTERECARDMINNEFGNIATANLDQIADIMEKVHTQKANGKATEKVNPGMPQEQLNAEDERIKLQIQGVVKKDEVSSILKKATNNKLKACIQLYGDFWDSNQNSQKYNALLNKINKKKEYPFFEENCALRKALESLVVNNSEDYTKKNKEKALSNYNKR